MKFDVVTFGSAVIDIFLDTDIAEKGRFMYYPVGSKLLLKNLRFDIGGGGTNTAVAFSRLGLKTGFVGKIGDDVEGKKILSCLADERVKFLGKTQKNELSGYSIILDSKENDRTIMTYKGVNNHLAIEDIKLRKIKTKWLYFSSLLEKSFQTQVKTAQILEKKGVKIAFNPSEYQIKKLDLKPLLKLTTILVLNKEEAELLAKSKAKLFKELHKLGPKIVVITDKNKPIMASDGIREYSLKPHNVKVVERTGAGDAFASGFVAGQIVGLDMVKSLELGLRESESVIGHFGAKNNLIRMKLK